MLEQLKNMLRLIEFDIYSMEMHDNSWEKEYTKLVRKRNALKRTIRTFEKCGG